MIPHNFYWTISLSQKTCQEIYFIRKKKSNEIYFLVASASLKENSHLTLKKSLQEKFRERMPKAWTKLPCENIKITHNEMLFLIVVLVETNFKTCYEFAQFS